VVHDAAGAVLRVAVPRRRGPAGLRSFLWYSV